MRHKERRTQHNLNKTYRLGAVQSMRTLVPHLVHLKTTGILSCFNLVYMAGLVHIQFYLKTESNTYVMGRRTFSETTEFTSEDDLLNELWSTEELVELEVKSMG